MDCILCISVLNFCPLIYYMFKAYFTYNTQTSRLRIRNQMKLLLGIIGEFGEYMGTLMTLVNIISFDFPNDSTKSWEILFLQLGLTHVVHSPILAHNQVRLLTIKEILHRLLGQELINGGILW